MNNMVLLLLFSHSHYFGTVGIAFIVLSSGTQTPTPAAPSRHLQGSALIQVNFEAFDLADVKIIENCRLNKLYFMQYYTALYSCM